MSRIVLGDCGHGAKLLDACGSDAPAIERMVNAGHMTLIERGAYSAIVHMSDSGIERELIICAFGGRFMPDGADDMRRLALDNDCFTIRAHTRKAGVRRLMRRYGFWEHERVFLTTPEGLRHG